MPNRLLSLLSDIERAIIANDPSPDEGTWDTMRLINFHQGLARLTLSVKLPAGTTSVRGTILLQHFTLADDTQCVKANLTWQGVENACTYAIYAKPLVNWNLEASQIAIKWLDGRVPVTEEVAISDSQAATPPLLSATG